MLYSHKNLYREALNEPLTVVVMVAFSLQQKIGYIIGTWQEKQYQYQPNEDTKVKCQ